MPTFLLLSVVLLVAQHFVHVADLLSSSHLSLSSLYIVFRVAKQFNQPLGDWDVSKVTTMYQSEWCPPSCLSSSLLPDPLTLSLSLSLSLLFTVFYSASQFNQPLGDWDVSSVENMYESEWCPPSCLLSSYLRVAHSVSMSDPPSSSHPLSLHFSKCFCMQKSTPFSRPSAVRGWPRELGLEMAGSPRPK